MTIIQFSKLMSKANDGKLEVEMWQYIRGNSGVAMIRKASGKREMVQVENIPDGFAK